jgi:hypothetical protein
VKINGCRSCAPRLELLGTLTITLLVHWFDRPAAAEDFARHRFQRRQLTDVYYSEGIAAGDLNRDGQSDVVYGPYWFAGPDFEQKREIYPAQAQPRERYADHFFAWIHDFNGDGWNDVLTAGFPGTPAYVYENPRQDGFSGSWTRHEVFPSVANESPHFTNIVADEQPELVCTHEGYFGYATFDPQRPWQTWTFHRISDKIAPVPFGHGLGVGDVDGDGRLDLLFKDGWFQQPASLAGGPQWPLHRRAFAPRGGAEMHAYDVDGDGDNDVITSLAAHEFGLVWHEQVRDGQQIAFRRHLILGDRAEQNRYGVLFSELHSVQLADIDGDGLKDIVTGKTYWSHHRQSPLWDAGAVIYWFRLVRGGEGVDWVPHRADNDAGIGRQVTVHDLNADGLPDILAGGMKGAHVLVHQRESVSEDQWRKSQPKPLAAAELPPILATPESIAPPRTQRVPGGIEGESLRVLGASGGKTSRQDMEAFKAARWSGGQQLFWIGAQPGDRLELELEVPQSGAFELTACFTKARDYATIELKLDGQPLGQPLDLFHPTDVVTTGAVSLGSRPLTAGKHVLVLEITGANAAAQPLYRVGLDYLRLTPTQPAPAAARP